MSASHANVYKLFTTVAGNKNKNGININVQRYVASMIFTNKATTKKKIHIFTKSQYLLLRMLILVYIEWM